MPATIRQNDFCRGQFGLTQNEISLCHHHHRHPVWYFLNFNQSAKGSHHEKVVSWTKYCWTFATWRASINALLSSIFGVQSVLPAYQPNNRQPPPYRPTSLHPFTFGSTARSGTLLKKDDCGNDDDDGWRRILVPNSWSERRVEWRQASKGRRIIRKKIYLSTDKMENVFHANTEQL